MAPDPYPVWITEWRVFEAITLTILEDTVQKLKATFCANDLMPSRLLKQTFDCVSLSSAHFI